MLGNFHDEVDKHVNFSLLAMVVEGVGARDNALATRRSFRGTCEISKLNQISLM